MRRSEQIARRKIFKSGNNIVVSAPRASLNLEEGSEASVSLDKDRGVIVVAPATTALAGVDAESGRQVAEFIEAYRPALEHLASARADDY